MIRSFIYYVFSLSLLVSCTGIETDLPEDTPGSLSERVTIVVSLRVWSVVAAKTFR